MLTGIQTNKEHLETKKRRPQLFHEGIILNCSTVNQRNCPAREFT
jgi:hypothetical protein